MPDTKYEQQSFLGGISAQWDPTKVSQASYPLLINGRVRRNVVEAVRKPARQNTLPDGEYQGMHASGSVLFVCVDGVIYYRDITTTNDWSSLGTTLIASTGRVYMESIPASTINIKRVGTVETVTFTNSQVRQTPEAIFVTDGTNQSTIIYPTGPNNVDTRTTQTYAEWIDNEDGSLREYVPIGKFPAMVGKRLVMAIPSATGRFSRIGLSVTGRPLDFVVRINEDGSKDGDALTTADAVDFDELTALLPVNSASDSYIACTRNQSYYVSPDTSKPLVFGEYQYIKRSLFPVGVLNPFCVVDLNGDTAFISASGVHSYNAVTNDRWEAASDPLSMPIYRYLSPSQSDGCCGDHNDYAYFALDTVFGPAVAVYDKTLKIWVSIDMYVGVGAIRQFCRVAGPDGYRLYFMTADGLFEHEGQTAYETAQFYMGDWNMGSGRMLQKFTTATAVMTNIYTDTLVKMSLFADGQLIQSTQEWTTHGSVYTAAEPLQPFRSGRASDTVALTVPAAPACFAYGILIEWNTAATLAFATATSQVTDDLVSQFNRVVNPAPLPANQTFKLVAGTDGAVTLSGTVIGCGKYSALQHRANFFGVMGLGDWDDPATPIAWYCNGQRYSQRQFDDVEFFFYNAGWNDEPFTQPPAHEPDGNMLGSAQANWLKAALLNSTARYKFVVIGVPPYSTGTYSADLRLPFHSWGASAVFSYGSNGYERTGVDGFYYYCVPEINDSPDTYLELTTDQFSFTTAFVSGGNQTDRYIVRR